MSPNLIRSIRKVALAVSAVLLAVVAAKWQLILGAGLFGSDGGVLGEMITRPFGFLVLVPLATSVRSQSIPRSTAFAVVQYAAFLAASVYLDFEVAAQPTWSDIDWVGAAIALVVVCALAVGFSCRAPRGTLWIGSACIVAAVAGLAAGLWFQSAVWVVWLAVIVVRWFRGRRREWS